MDGLKYDHRLHLYTFNGKLVTGVTSALKLFSPDAETLEKWIANTAVKRYTKEIKKTKEKPKYKEIEAVAKEEPARLRDEAGERGTEVHDRFAVHAQKAIKETRGLIGGRVRDTNEEVNALLKLFRAEKIRILESERIVFSPEYWYAGRLDILIKYQKKIFVVDIKTGSIRDRKPFAQTAAYAFALKEAGESVDYTMVICTKKVKDRRVKKVIPEEDIQVSKNIRRDFELFKACLAVYRNIGLDKKVHDKE